MSQEQDAASGGANFGKYTLVDRIAVGGMAEVFRALAPTPVGEARLIALKRMLPSLATEAGARAMFETEASLNSLIQHRNVVEVIDHGTVVNPESGEEQAYLALEYVRGLDLWRVNRALTLEGAKFPPQLALFIMSELLEGLIAVHNATDASGRPMGLVHRDVSPSNLLLSKDGEVKLADFGIAFAQFDSAAPPSSLGKRTKGKLGYLSPEQVLGQTCDHRTDVFSAAVIAAELLIGGPLFAGSSELAVLLAIRDGRVHPLVRIMPSLPSGLGELILEALNPEPEGRTGSAELFHSRLTGYITEDRASLSERLGQVVRNAEGTDVGQLESATPTGVVTARWSTPPSDESPTRELEQFDGARFDDADQRRESAPPSTAEIPAIEYFILRKDGSKAGPLTYAAVVEKVAVGDLGPLDRVGETGQDFVPVATHPALKRHLPPSTLTPTTAENNTPASPDEVLPLKDGGFIAALGRSVLRKDTGLWLCEAGAVRKEVYVKDGVPEFVSSNLAGELLGEYLVSRSIISRGELDMALAVMPRFEGRLGDTLAALGLMEPVHLFRHIGEQVRGKLIDLFTWTSGHAALYKGVPPPSIAFPLGLDPWKVLTDGIDHRLDEGYEDERLALNARYRRSKPVPVDLRDARLPLNAQSLLSAMSHPLSVQEASDAIGDRATNARATRRAILLLEHVGIVERVADILHSE